QGNHHRNGNGCIGSCDPKHQNHHQEQRHQHSTYQTVTTGAGDYTAVNLPSRTYELTFRTPGLKKLVRSNVVVAVSETIRVDASLQVGEANDTVTVTADAEVLQTDSPVVGQVLQNRQVRIRLC